jgi:hypothetical protein
MDRLAEDDDEARLGASEAMAMLGPEAGPAVPLILNTMAEATGEASPKRSQGAGAAASGAVASLIAAAGHKSQGALGF